MSGTSKTETPDSVAPEGAEQEEPTGTPTSDRYEQETARSANERKSRSEKHRYTP
ncbi:MAG: hypothetical protein WDN04_06660 [Rhodospirillales bacterium]